jgi:hypothetical protein
VNNSLNRLIDGMIAQLRGEIIPRLDDEFARGQAYGVVDALNNLKPRIDWLVTPLAEEVGEQQALLATLNAAFGPEPGFPGQAQSAAASQQPVHALAASDIEAQRNDLDEQISAAIDWLGRQRADLPPARVQEAEAHIKSHLQRQLKRELSLTPKPLFGEISKG